MSMWFAATYPTRPATLQLARDDLDTMIRAPVGGSSGNRSPQTMTAGQ